MWSDLVTVQSLVLHGFGNPTDKAQSSVHLTLFESHLPALTALELDDSFVTTAGGDITCLSKLKSLHLTGELQVTLLTDLTYLNLSKARYVRRMHGMRRLRPSLPGLPCKS